MIDYDRIEGWFDSLRVALSAVVTERTLSSIQNSKPNFVEDSRDTLFKFAERDAVIDATLDWLRSSTIAGFHGTRLTDEEVSSVREAGLLPLAAAKRRDRLARALSKHPDWDVAAQKLDAVLQQHGPGKRAGGREGTAHLTLSRAGLVEDFNHYLTHGSEFDQHSAHAVLGDEGVALLARDGRATVIQFAVPGEAALSAAHPYFTVEDLRARGDVPNVANEFLKAWSYRVAYPGFDPRTLQVDCGMIFQSVPATWITNIETLAD